MAILYFLYFSAIIYSLGGSVVYLPDPNGNTLDYYLCNSATIDVSNTDFVLLSNSSHPLGETNALCVIKDAHNVTIRSESSSSRSIVNCTGGINERAGFAFFNVSQLIISNIIFSDCGGSFSEEVVDFMNRNESGVPYFTFSCLQLSTVVFDSCTNLVLRSVHIQNYLGFGMILKDSQGFTDVQNIDITTAINFTGHDNMKLSGGGLVMLYTDKAIHNNASAYLERIVITDGYTLEFNSSLLSEVGNSVSQPIISAAGLTIIIIESEHVTPSITIRLKDLSVKNNQGGGVLFLYKDVVHSSIEVMFANISSCLTGTDTFQDLIGESLTTYYVLTRQVKKHNSSPSLTLQDTNFITSKLESCRRRELLSAYNLSLVLIRAVGGYIGDNSKDNHNQKVVFNNTFFMKDFPGISEHVLGIGLYVQAYTSIIMTLYNTTAISFKCSKEKPNLSCERVGALAFRQMKELNVANGLFKNSEGCSAMYVENSNVHFTGKITISHNQGLVYGALQFVRSSRLYFVEPLTLEMMYNTAVYGGAIYSVSDFFANCVLQFAPQYHYDQSNYTMMNVSLKIKENTALLSGNTIYGYPLHGCGHTQFDNIQNISFYEILLNLFQPEQKISSKEVSSPASTICLCYEEPFNMSCIGKQALNKTAYPGQTINVSMIAVDGIASVYGAVTARFIQIPENVKIHLKQEDVYFSLPAGKCSERHFTVFHNGTIDANVQLKLTVTLRVSETFINLTLKGCPNGFTADDDTCHCLPIYLTFGCADSVIHRRYNYWIGYTSNSLYGYAENCPSGYCNESLTNTTISTNLNESSPICNGGRTGTLCAFCPNGKSIIFGSVECMKCSDIYILTILLFGVLGVLLVVLLFFLQLTVKVGTINGPIFYANLLSTGFTLGYLQEVSPKYYYIMRVFISFLNLDLGFPLCFYNGMTEPEYRLLQFLFPVYVWCIIGIIIKASKHSTRLSNVIGKHSVAVLATLVQLSYSKIMTNIADSFPATSISVNYDQSKIRSTFSVWFVAGVEYGSALHIIHMVISIIFLLVFIFPYTLVSTLAPFLVRYHIVARYMPLTDAIYAPYKDKWRFWFGARLVLLLVLLICRASSSGESFTLNLGIQLLSVITFTLLQIHIRPFKNGFIQIIDLFFMLNFCAASFFALALRNGRTLFNITAVIISTAFVGFVLIIVYHLYLVFKERIPKKQKTREENALTIQTSEFSSSNSECKHMAFDKFREPLMEYL